MHLGGLKLSRRHRFWLHGTITALFLTGVVWWLLHASQLTHPRLRISRSIL